jgi:hypothetical protein
MKNKSAILHLAGQKLFDPEQVETVYFALPVP